MKLNRKALLTATIAAVVLTTVVSWVAMSPVSVSAEAEAAVDSATITTPPPRQATLLFVGDAMQHSPQFKRAHSLAGGKGYDYSECFTLMEPRIKAADYAVCNLEVPLGGGPTYSGYPCFSAPDAYAEALRDAGFDMMLTANNHCLDSGPKAARRTLKVLDELGVAHLGTYSTAAERDSLVPLICDINGIRFGFLNYTYGTNGIKPTKGIEVAYINRDKMAREIELARQKGAEVLVVCMHWGEEYQLRPNSEQRSLAQFLAKNGVDIVIGAHPHVVQPMETVDVMVADSVLHRMFVAYSLGNFISNQNDTNSRGGALVELTVEDDSIGHPRLKNVTHDTFFVAKPAGRNDNFRVVPRSMADSIVPAAQRAQMKRFFSNADRVFAANKVSLLPE